MYKILAIMTLQFILFKQTDAQVYTHIEAENWSAVKTINSVESVTKESCSDANLGQDVGWIDLGDWMDYSINIPTTGMYKLALRVASSNTGNIILIKNSSGTLLNQVNLPATWGGQIWTTVYAYVTFSQAGTQTIRFESGSSSTSFFWNFNWFEISTTSVKKIEGEDYKLPNSLVGNTETAWGDGEYGGAGTIAHNIDAVGDNMDYTVDVPIAGIYTMKLRVATPNSNNVVLIKNSAGTQIGSLTLTATGGWQTWGFSTTTLTVNLSAGSQDIKIYLQSGGGFNLNFFELIAPAGTGGTNQPPTLNAGVDQTLTLSSGSTTITANLSGTASDVDGTISTYSWTKVSGPTEGTITSPAATATTVTGLVQGTYVFRLTVTDNGGATSYDDVTVAINPAPVSGAWTLTGNAGTNPTSQFIGTTDNQELVFRTNNLPRVRITAGGDLWAKKIKVTTDGFADYVFDPSYKLRSMEELRRYIQKYRHLPDVPSASQVANEGLSVGDNQVVLLKKIEELTLYVIRQNEELKKQAKEIQALKKQIQTDRKK